MLQWGLQLRKWRDENRLSHAYLVTGERSKDLHDFAMNAVRVLQCEAPSGDSACGVCIACVQIASDNHPNVYWLTPEGTTLKIQQMRTAMKMDARKSADKNLHIFVMEDVHKLTSEAANSILKWLEEPHDKRLFLLLTTAQGTLLPTLRSRVMLLRIDDTKSSMPTFQEAVSAITSNDEGKSKELSDLVCEFAEIAMSKKSSDWVKISGKYSKWGFTPEQSLMFADLMTFYFRDQAAKSTEMASIRRYALLAMGVFQVRKQIQSHVNSLLAWEAYFIRNASQGAVLSLHQGRR